MRIIRLLTIIMLSVVWILAITLAMHWWGTVGLLVVIGVSAVCVVWDVYRSGKRR